MKFFTQTVLVNLFGIMQNDSLPSLSINLTALSGLRGEGEAVTQLQINGQYLQHRKISM